MIDKAEDREEFKQAMVKIEMGLDNENERVSGLDLGKACV